MIGTIFIKSNQILRNFDLVQFEDYVLFTTEVYMSTIMLGS